MPPSPTFRAFVVSERDRVAAELAGRAGGEASSAVARKKALMIELARQWKARYPEAAKASAAAAAKPVNPATVSTTSATTAPAARPSWHPPVNSLRTSLLGTGAGETPVAMRMRAIYYLRSIGGPDELAVLCAALPLDATSPVPHSPLLRHEVAYVLGQLRDPVACDVLEAVLSDHADDVMVRHECAEALGAIGAPRSLPVLERFARASEGGPEIQQTCQVATDFCRWKASGGESRGEARPGVACACMLPAYSSHDPAPADPATDSLTIEEVGARLRDKKRPLFERYGAMFALRNRGGDDAVRELGIALVQDDTSALLRHEVAFVLGQMQRPVALDALAESLSRAAEHSMVRHESAEALGALEFDPQDPAAARCRELLHQHATKTHEHDPVVRESCEVALDATDYWSAAAGIPGFKQLKTDFEVRPNHFNIKCG